MLFHFKNLQSANHEDGFTLIELLIVVVIIGILAAIAIPIFVNQQKAATAASVKSDVRNTVTTIQTALVSNFQSTNIRTIVPVDSRPTSAGNTISIGTTMDLAQSTLVAGNGQWDSYVVVGSNNANIGDKTSNYYYFNSLTGRYNGVGLLNS